MRLKVIKYIDETSEAYVHENLNSLISPGVSSGASEMTSLVTDRSPEPGVWQTVFQTVWWLLTKLPLGEGQYEWLQLRHAINLHKGLSLPFCLLVMYLSDNWSYPASVYTAAHGTYG